MTKMRSAATTRTTGRAPARRKPGLPGMVARALLWCVALTTGRPVAVLGAIAVLVGVTAIVWNTTHQNGRHPAPLFAAASPAFPAIPLPVPRPDPVQLAAATPSPAAETPRADPIAALIRADAGGRPVPETKPVDTGKLVSAQKALVKLGYGPLKTDGLFGATTRGAIERFERDRNLPVTGSVAGRTARQLATLSGLPVE